METPKNKNLSKLFWSTWSLLFLLDHFYFFSLHAKCTDNCPKTIDLGVGGGHESLLNEPIHSIGIGQLLFLYFTI